MPVILTDATEAVAGLLEGVVREFFPRLARLDPPLAIHILMAEDPKGATPLKEHGRGVPAIAKRAGREERSEGGPDLRILVDSARWRNAGSDRARRGILARQLRRVEVGTWPDGRTPKTDDAGRYVVRLTPYDWVVAGFKDVAEWFGEDAPEVRSLRAVGEYLGQKMLPFDEATSADEQGEVVARLAEIEADEAREAG